MSQHRTVLLMVIVRKLFVISRWQELQESQIRVCSKKGGSKKGGSHLNTTRCAWGGWR